MARVVLDGHLDGNTIAKVQDKLLFLFGKKSRTNLLT